MDIREVRKRLHETCQINGGVREWAESKGLAFGYVYSVIRGDAKPGKKILKAMGLRKAFSLKKNPVVMKFEDIRN